MHVLRFARTTTLACALVFCVFSPQATLATDTCVYRFYSEVYTSHFYTINDQERNQLLTNTDWQYEGVAAQAQTDNINQTTALYRFWSEGYRSHFYTTSVSERDQLIESDANWSYEGVAYYVYTQPSEETTAFYRFWSARYQSHFYTASETEKDFLVANDANWIYEGIAYYAKPFTVGASLILRNNFEAAALGNYGYDQFTSDVSWPRVAWSEAGDRASIVETDNEQKLRITYPASEVGTDESGGQALIDLGSDFPELYFRQSISFENGFDWQRGGKLPGLSSGGSTWSGGNVPRNGEGYSARYMWRDNGRAILYLYHVDQDSSFGDEIDLGLHFETGKEYTLTQRIVRNSGDTRNGVLEVWVSVDGAVHQKVLDKTDVRFGLGDGGYTDSLYFSTYYGGGDKSWAPDTTSYATFDDFIVTQSRFGDLP